jgi:hypothetical protein
MTMRLRVSYAVALAMLGTVSSLHTDSRAPARPPLYDANPQHLWNRVHQHLYIRTARDGTEWGFDTVDPLVWRETRHLLTGPSHVRALRVLDEFLASRGERLVRDPLKRAVFQRDLWAIFDWTAALDAQGNQQARFALQQRVARVMRRVALPRKQIEALPDTYAAAVAARLRNLPAGLFDPDGPWVSVGGPEPITPHHAGELSRSAFIVLWSLPGGANETASYLRKLWTFPQPFVRDESFDSSRDGEIRTKLNPALPPIPAGTRIALVLKMLLIDDAGAIVPSPIVESVQLRTFPGPDFAEVRLTRAALFAGSAGGLRTVTADETAWITFSSMGIDPFEYETSRTPVNPPRELGMCVNCHDASFQPQVMSVRSLDAMLSQRSFVDSRHERWAAWFTQPIVAAGAKSRRYDWGLLRGFWQAAAP